MEDHTGVYTVTLTIEVTSDFQDHPANWDWEHLLNCDAAMDPSNPRVSEESVEYTPIISVTAEAIS